jgi:methylmalonyl-CoA/ethylmalonyl-CoA epimerase
LHNCQLTASGEANPIFKELQMSEISFEGLGEIGQINIPVYDLDQAIRFYQDQLGMKFMFQAPNLAFFDCMGIRLVLSIPEDAAFDHPSSIIYFKVPDIQAYTQALKNRDVEFTNEPHLIAKMPDHDLWMSFFKDRDGNTLALMAEVR